MHGAHQVAQKFTNSQAPLNMLRFIFLPSVVEKETSGIGSGGFNSTNFTIPPSFGGDVDALVNEVSGKIIKKNTAIVALSNVILKCTRRFL